MNIKKYVLFDPDIDDPSEVEEGTKKQIMALIEKSLFGKDSNEFGGFRVLTKEEFEKWAEEAFGET